MIKMDMTATFNCSHPKCPQTFSGVARFHVMHSRQVRLVKLPEHPAGWRLFTRNVGILSPPDKPEAQSDIMLYCPEHEPEKSDE